MRAADYPPKKVMVMVFFSKFVKDLKFQLPHESLNFDSLTVQLPNPLGHTYLSVVTRICDS